MSFFKGVFGKAQFSNATSRAEGRVAKMDARIESMRKGTVVSRDSQVRGTVQVSSSRDYLNKSLGKTPGPTRANSIGRMASTNSLRFGSGISGTGMAPKLPPMRPMGK